MQDVHALIVDDNPLNLEVMSRLLNSLQISCTPLQDPTQIEAVLEQIEYIDVVFLDLEMPHANGYDVFEYLTQTLQLDVPIVACTIHSTEIHTAREMGFHSFLGSPLNVHRFPDQVRRILEGERVWEPQ